MKRLLVAFIYLFISTYTVSSQELGAWDTHFSYSNSISQIVKGDLTYVLTDGKLFSYNANDEQTEIYVKKEGGNNDIDQIAYSDKNKCLIIFRKNADIDLLYEASRLTNIPDLKNTSQNIDKGLNSIFVNGDYAYLATNFGLLILNLSKGEIAETAIFKIPFYAICIYQNKFYAATQNGILSIDETKNLLDINNWDAFSVSSKYKFSDYTFDDTEIRGVGVFKDKLHFFVPKKAIYVLEDANTVGRTLEGKAPQIMLPVNNDCLISFGVNIFWNFKAIEQYQNTNVNGLQYVFPDIGNSNKYWCGIDGYNLSWIKTTDGTSNYEFVTSKIKPDGPLTNFPFFMRYDRGKLLVVGGGYNYDNLNKPAQLCELSDGKWFNYSKSEIDSKIGGGFSSRDFTSVIADPTDINHLYVTSWGDGLYEFRNQSFIQRYTPSNTGGVLQDIFGGEGYVRMNGMCYDASGNLWLTNAMVRNPLKTLQKNGTWTNLYYSEIANDAATNDQNLMIDKSNNKWLITTKTGTTPPYLFLSNDKGTITDTSDDSKRYISTFVDQDGNRLAIQALNQTVEDLDGNIWVATDIGPYIIYPSSGLFTKTVVFNKIKIARNDGTNDADILLENMIINKIAIDGANRKWIGTKSSGVYLVSSNGDETIHNFNTENSPLPSNNVISLAIDSKTGLVYIGTDAGVVSFAGDATSGQDQFGDVYAYPNPVRPDYNGSITITGLQNNSNVKITDLNGNIIAQGQSLGGLYSWNGCNKNGKKVATGVYLVFAASEDGSAGVVTKIMVVR